jgi:1,2-phenylacetyl-CoA epoxidase catalytic subunit
MTGEEFVGRLDGEVHQALERLGLLSGAGEASEDLRIDRLLIIALKNELEATEIAAIWMADTEELDVKLALARQVGDEAKHYRAVCDRLKELSTDADQIDPRESGYSPMFQYLRGLQGTISRIAAGQFAREGIALVRNQCFIEYSEAVGDSRTAALYRDVIQPDERHHHELGRKLLARYARSSQDQSEAKQAALRTIELAEEIQEMARLKAGLSRAPGC